MLTCFFQVGQLLKSLEKWLCSIGDRTSVTDEDIISEICMFQSSKFNLFVSIAEYKTLCPGGEGFRPNPITVILEGNNCFCFP